jgi:regulator of sigma E protease
MEKIQGKHEEKGGEAKEESKDEKAAEPEEPAEPAEVVPDAPAWKRIVVAVAGPFGNIVLAVFLAVLLALVPWTRFGELGTEVGSIVPGCPAESAGIVEGDTVVAVNSNPVNTWFELLTEVQIAGDRETEFRLRTKDGAEKTVKITPKKEEATGKCYIGIQGVRSDVSSAYWMPNRNPIEQLKWDAMSIVRVLKALVTPKESGRVAKSIGGPILIAKGLYVQVREDFWDALGFLRFLCINLAILNLLPIPVLDGGHCMFALYEIVTRRKPSRKFVDTVTNVFGYLFIALFVWLIWSDSSRIWKANQAESEMEAEAAASAEPPENPAK